MRQPLIVLLERDDTARELYTENLVSGGFRVRAEALFDDAVAALKKGGVPLVVAGIAPGGATAYQLASAIRRASPHTVLLALLGREAAEGALRAVRDGAFEALTKPISADALLLSVHRCLQTTAMLERTPELRRHVESFQAARRLQRIYEPIAMADALVDASLAATGADAGFVLAPGDAGPQVIAARYLEEAVARELATCWSSAAFPAAADSALWFTGGQGPLSGVKGRGARHAAELIVLRVGAPGSEHMWVTLLYKEKSKALADLLARGDAARAALLAELARYGMEAEFALTTAARFADGAGEVSIDPLTDLADGRTLARTLTRELARVRKNGGHAAVLSLAVAGLAEATALQPLAAGQALVEASRILLRAVRDVDMVARTGEYEFGVILMGTDAVGAARAAKRLHATFVGRKFLSREGLELKLTAGVGVAAFPDHGDAGQALLDAAAQARARAGNGVELAQPAHRPPARAARVRERT